MYVAEIMVFDPLFVRGAAVLSEAARFLDECCLRHLLVVSEALPAGVLSDRELLEAGGRLVPSSADDGEFRRLLVRDVMRPEPVTVQPDASTRLARDRISAQADADEQGKLVGMLTVTDVLAHIARAFD